MKTCTKCGAVKPEDDFYRSRAAGYIAACKECTKAAVRSYRAANLERVREYDRARGADPKRRDANRKRAWKYKDKKYQKAFVERNPEKRAAHIAVGNAIRDGKLKRKPCERCGFVFGVHAHHEDYSKPLDVVWLCKRCHGERHREINEERRRSAA